MEAKNKNVKKLKIGWFSFSCCEDSTIVFTEMLNDKWEEWRNKIEFKHIRILQRKNVLEDIDVAFIEGAVTSPTQEKKIIKIKKASKKIVAVGSCAVTGIPSGHRNQFDQDAQASIQYLLDRFGQSAKVSPISAVIPVDDEVPGCPMDEIKFLEILNKYLKEFGIK